jgi:predicted nucleotidyltransferase
VDRPRDLEPLRSLASGYPGLSLLILHGSRGRGDYHERSDWDFAYLGDDDLDELQLRSDLTNVLRTDNIDLAGLDGAGGLLRFLAARNGILVFERTRGNFEDFCIAAALFWFDIEPIIRCEHREILAALDERS